MPAFWLFISLLAAVCVFTDAGGRDWKPYGWSPSGWAVLTLMLWVVFAPWYVYTARYVDRRPWSPRA